MARVSVRVTPGARENAVIGWQDATLRVRVRARPEHGKANDAVCRVIAKALDVPMSRVGIAHGSATRDKVLHVEGIDDAEVRRRLTSPR